MLLGLPGLLDHLGVKVKTVEGLLVGATNSVVGSDALVGSVVVDGEGAVRAHELGHRGVVVLRDLLAMQSLFYVTLLGSHHARRDELRAGGGALIASRVDAEAVDDFAADLERSAEEVLVLLDLVLAHVDLGQAQCALLDRSRRHRVTLVVAHAHQVRGDMLHLCLSYFGPGIGGTRCEFDQGVIALATLRHRASFMLVGAGALARLRELVPEELVEMLVLFGSLQRLAVDLVFRVRASPLSS